ncbi:regulatory protein [Streptomyces viridochromogenes DSM 40736]|uniref:Regulatory protein n=1 Tax=Streptomyces viridochromogenes (strain DSM 40736 / JCM 4977 / BCRC 1201 / Tue 494) TaxID=591159 RepID=D9XDM2_STRVT|nr:IclR family transcriptional regulator [Streptomyces viridochromogenes]EFL30401.1 regulatory protein [Streptomyces viridochromogenes DSM 40736]
MKQHKETSGGPTDPGRLVGSDRVLAVLRELARYPGGVGLDELTRVIGSPKPTVHRALGALRRAGLADQDDRSRYVLGDEFLRMAFAHHEARPDHVRVRPVLEALAHRFGETAHYAVLDGREVVYRAKVDPPTGAVRLTSTIGGRNPAHTTAVGKLLLARRLTSPAEVERWIGDPGADGAPGSDAALERRTPRSLCTTAGLFRELALTRERGYGVDDQENETGVNCLAVPLYLTSPSTPSGAVSVSALAYRTPLSLLVDALDEIRELLGPLGEPHS